MMMSRKFFLLVWIGTFLCLTSAELILSTEPAATEPAAAATDCSSMNDQRQACRKSPDCKWLKNPRGRNKRKNQRKKDRCIPTPTQEQCEGIQRRQKCRAKGCRWKKSETGGTCGPPPPKEAKTSGEIDPNREDCNERYACPILDFLQTAQVLEMPAEEALQTVQKEYSPDSGYIVVLCHQTHSSEYDDDGECFLKNRNWNRIRLVYDDSRIVTDYTVG